MTRLNEGRKVRMAALANLFGYILNFLYNWLKNYGWAIIVFSVLLKVVLLPLTYKQQKQMKKSAKMQKEINKIQLKYKNNPEMLNKETMELYKREKVSPFSGCLSSILQLVIFVSVFYLVSRPLTYMKKVDPQVIQNYENQIFASQNATTDQSTNTANAVNTQNVQAKGNNTRTAYREIKIIELKSAEDERVNLNMNFLGLNLSKVPSENWKDFKVLIIPLLYVITTFVNIKISTAMTEGKKDDDDDEDEERKPGQDELESMQSVSKSMNYMMPIVSVAIALIAPLGLSLYWLVSNILQLLERVVITKIIDTQEKKVKRLK